ncbi:MAG: FemAB family PEP-CTERM system-associated protein [Alteromonadaceae bacterium]|nr:FemAB family PEP-CTERM system-associated protein [Alteromonadaceae bacterium]
MSGNCQISTLTNSGFSKWDEYVKRHENGTFFHLSGWQTVIKNSFSHSCYYLFAEIDNKLCGVLPLVEVKSALFGHALVSTPFCVYGGAITDNEEIARYLEQEAVQLAEKLEVDYLELRYQQEQQNGMLLKQVHSSFGCEIPDDNDQILAKIKKKQRAVIRHAMKNELSSSVGADVDTFYQLLSTSYRNLGTPIFSKKYFRELINIFGDDLDITVISDNENRPSSAVLNFYYNKQVLPYYGGGNAGARYLKSADFMYYQVMCNASEKGFTWFDFGRSKNDSGPYKYKKHWGMEPKPLYYYYHLVKTDDLPNLSPNNPKYKFFINMWQKLPLKLSQFLGPFLSKYLG